jgi:hypothetical protein
MYCCFFIYGGLCIFQIIYYKNYETNQMCYTPVFVVVHSCNLLSGVIFCWVAWKISRTINKAIASMETTQAAMSALNEDVSKL